jgi:protein TonB
MRRPLARRLLACAALALACRAGAAIAGPLQFAAMAPAARAVMAEPAPAPAPTPDLDVRAHFEQRMSEIVADLADVVVTSKHRTDADQERIAALGYKPHRHSQHKLGLAWDCAGPMEALETIRDRARSHGFTPLIMKSPVTGVSYVHVQRYARRKLPANLLPPPAPEAPAVFAEEAPAVAAVQATPADPVDPIAQAPLDGPPPKPVGVAGLELPRELRKKKISGRIVLLVKLSAEGEVVDLRVDSSDLPDFEPFVVGEVRQWRFTPPTRQGEPVEAFARLPIPIHVN